jgi:hypothetical protein
MLEMRNSFTKIWVAAIEADPAWQFQEMIEDIEEEDPELAKAVIVYMEYENMVYDLVRQRMWLNYGIYIE